jgi:hypothetical protein
MKAFIERVFKSKKQKQKELLDEITNTEVEGQSTEAVVEAIIEEVKEDIKKEKHIDCECKECINKVKQNAK